ncbi:MAG: class I SAM-dependent rRNA methyltransferase [Alphaproteobacteria bacterium]|nr:class I SAM-dependent rRNA methyltransferase [Alphaproteobacteria bacterium]
MPDANPKLLVTAGWPDYALLDSGGGLKLEKYGRYTVVRPEPQAMWEPALAQAEWGKADAVFASTDDDDAGRWKYRGKPAETWPMEYSGVKFLGRFTAFRHMGVFPEQHLQWEQMAQAIRGAGRKVRILNMFAYTGVASLIAAQAGAEITHLDASKKAIQWAKDNQQASGQDERSVRWICDDAQKFVAREVRRGAQYDGIILDPPKFGRGPKGEKWELFDHLPQMLKDCRKLLGEKPLFLMLTAYSIRASFLSLHGLMQDVLGDMPGKIESGELAIEEKSKKRLIGTALYSTWSAR